MTVVANVLFFVAHVDELVVYFAAWRATFNAHVLDFVGLAKLARVGTSRPASVACLIALVILAYIKIVN